MVKEIKVIFSCKTDRIKFKSIPICSYNKSIKSEIEERNINRKQIIELLEQMYMIRALEEMLEEISRGIYKPLPKFSYIGPTHLSIGQEATAAGAISAIGADDYITSSHRGYADAMAKGYNVIKKMDTANLKKLCEKRLEYLEAIGENINESDSREILEEKVLKIHVYRMIAELFGRVHGYCGGVGGGINDKTSDEIIEELMKSKIFKQGYELDELADYEFSLFYPVNATLNQFSDNYDELMEYISK